MARKRDLLERLNDGGVLCAEGYLFEMERRGYLTAGDFVPEVALEHPECLRRLHKDFQHAGSDVMEAFTYNAHRGKLKTIGKEDMLEDLNRAALRIAVQVAGDVEPGEEPSLVAGNISNSNIWNPADKDVRDEVRGMFEEMVQWGMDEGVDFFVGETFYFAEEAFCALDVIKEAGLPAVVTIAPMEENTLRDGWSVVDTCRELEQKGAEVVGMNCFRGPQTMLPYLREIRENVSCHVAGLPVPYRTTAAQPTFFSLEDRECACPAPHGRAFPTALDPLMCNRYEIRKFAGEAYRLGVKYLGVCCGAFPVHIREVAEAMGRTPAASRYSENMAGHFMYGSKPQLRA